MTKITVFLSLAFILYSLPLLIYAQQNENNTYLISAPYNGLDGSPKSLIIKSYYLKENLREEDYVGEEYENMSEDERYNILRGAMYATVRYDFDRNGYPTLIECKKISDKDNRKGKLEIVYREEIKRDKNSLAISRAFTQRDGRRVIYKLVSRKDNKELYKTKRIKLVEKELIIEYKSDTISYMESVDGEYKIVNQIGFNKNQLLNYWKQIGLDGLIAEFFINYAYDRYVQDAYYAVYEKDYGEPLVKEGATYMLYEADEAMEKQNGLTRNWKRRDRAMNTGFYMTDRTMSSFDEQTISY